MVDLGSWAGESYRMPDENTDENPEDGDSVQSDQAASPEDRVIFRRDKKILH